MVILDETLDENVFCQVGEKNKPHLIGVLRTFEKRWVSSDKIRNTL